MEEISTHKYFLIALRELFPKNFDSQKALALTAGVSRSVINEIFKGNRHGRPDTHQKIAQAFGYDLFEFYDKGRQILEESKKDSPGREDENQDRICVPGAGSEALKEKRGRPRKVENLDHDEIIRRFKDKESARRVNMMLVELESKDPDLYRQAEVYVSALYDTLKVKKTANE